MQCPFKLACNWCSEWWHVVVSAVILSSAGFNVTLTHFLSPHTESLQRGPSEKQGQGSGSAAASVPAGKNSICSCPLKMFCHPSITLKSSLVSHTLSSDWLNEWKTQHYWLMYIMLGMSVHNLDWMVISCHKSPPQLLLLSVTPPFYLCLQN